MKKYLHISIVLLFFSFGTYFWKIKNTGTYVPESDHVTYHKVINNKYFVMVGKHGISFEDIEWEYNLLTSGLLADSQLTSIPEVFNQDEQLQPLRERIVSNMIERKLLYEFVTQDQDFSMADPARYTDCIGEWQKSIDSSSEVVFSSQDKERLKNRLCERDIIQQYLNEKIFSKIEIADREIADFYVAHSKKYDYPERVIIRQLVLPSEKEAKSIRHKLRSYNFEKYAKEYSITPEAENGGLLGPFSRGEMPRIFDVAFQMKRGEIKGILKSTYGFHIIKLEKKLPRSKLSLGQARPLIEIELKKQKQEKEFQKWIELALSAIPVESPRPI